jgi:hypothetical protein
MWQAPVRPLPASSFPESETGRAKTGLACGLLLKALENGYPCQSIKARNLFDGMYASLADVPRGSSQGDGAVGCFAGRRASVFESKNSAVEHFFQAHGRTTTNLICGAPHNVSNAESIFCAERSTIANGRSPSGLAQPFTPFPQASGERAMPEEKNTRRPSQSRTPADSGSAAAQILGEC